MVDQNLTEEDVFCTTNYTTIDEVDTTQNTTHAI